MGQYYNPVILNEDGGHPVLGWAYSHDYGNGLKLMEHSYVGNRFVNAFESLLIPGSEFHKKPVVWAGDYADEEVGSNRNLYDYCDEHNQLSPQSLEGFDAFYPYVVNHTQKKYVNKLTVPDNNGWLIHPLPLLTCEGNGRGGGDFHGDSSLIGSWARNVISIESEVPEGYTELVFDLKED